MIVKSNHQGEVMEPSDDDGEDQFAFLLQACKDMLVLACAVGVGCFVLGFVWERLQ